MKSNKKDCYNRNTNSWECRIMHSNSNDHKIILILCPTLFGQILVTHDQHWTLPLRIWLAIVLTAALHYSAMLMFWRQTPIRIYRGLSCDRRTLSYSHNQLISETASFAVNQYIPKFAAEKRAIGEYKLTTGSTYDIGIRYINCAHWIILSTHTLFAKQRRRRNAAPEARIGRIGPWWQQSNWVSDYRFLCVSHTWLTMPRVHAYSHMIIPFGAWLLVSQPLNACAMLFTVFLIDLISIVFGYFYCFCAFAWLFSATYLALTNQKPYQTMLGENLRRLPCWWVRDFSLEKYYRATNWQNS